jgi:hypothetical protein
MRPKERPVDLSAAWHEDEDVVVGVPPHHDRADQLIRFDALQRGALLGAAGSLGADDPERHPRGGDLSDRGRFLDHVSRNSA